LNLKPKNNYLTRRYSRHNSFDVGVMFLADLGLPWVGNMLPLSLILLYFEIKIASNFQDQIKTNFL